MPQKTHTMHGRDHETHGADPIRGLIPTGVDTLDERIAALAPAGFWKLNESSGSVAADSSGNDQDLSTFPPALDPLWGAPAGPPGQQAANMENGTSGIDGTASTLTRTWPSLEADFTAGIWISRNTDEGTMVMGQGNPARLGGTGWQLTVLSSSFTPANTVRATMATGLSVDALNPLAEDTWAFLAFVYNAAVPEFKLYIDGLLQDAADATGYDPVGSPSELWIGHDIGLGDTVQGARFTGSYGFLVNRVVTGTELLNLTEEVTGGGVVVVGPGGEITIEPPGTEIEHGDGEEDETPVTGPGPGIGPVNANGWHYLDHFEYVVLYDSSPGRFDVPPRKWVRVPFNTVRIQRRWELESGYFQDAWLPDDRGLSEHAKNGTLLVTPGMTFSGGPLATEQEISGWYSVEYPMLDWTRLPNYPPGEESSPDHYARGARMTNTTNGSVLRAGAALPDHPSWRVFFDWPFFTPASGDEGIWFVNADNPYPYYPIWAGRPLNKPLPYPKFGNTESLDSYQTSAGNPGFDLESMVSRTFLEAGAALSLQAWQDTPWPLRFGTDKYPPYTPQEYIQKWRKRPCLLVHHYYDPDTVDHETGLLV